MDPLLGLATGTNQKESAMAELSVLERMTAKQEQKEQENLMAQQQEQAMYEQFYQKSDALLGKDRARVNSKFLNYQKEIKEAISNSGLSRADFMKAGGLSKINEIKNGVLQSEEFSRYKTNQENNTRLMMAMSDPKLRHLVNPNDIESMKAYEANEDGGEIKYSGLLNEVIIPPSQNFMLGENIPLEKVASYQGNMFKIMTNYKLVNPDSPDLDLSNEADVKTLKNFMIKMGYGGTGSNKAMAEQKAAQYRARQEAKQKSNKITLTGQYTNIFNEISDGLKPEDIIDGITNENGETVDFMDYQMSNRDNAKKIISDNKTAFRGKNVSFDNGSFGLEQWIPIPFASDLGRSIDNAFDDSYAIKGGREIMSYSKNQVAEKILGVTLDNGYARQFKPDNNMYNAAGVKIKDNTESIEPKDYKVLGVSTAFKMLATNDEKNVKAGDPVIMMNVVGQKGEIKEDANKNINEAYKGKNYDGNARMTSVLALQADDGEIVYREIDLSKKEDQAVLSDIVQSNELNSVIQESETNMQIRNAVKALSEEEQQAFEANINSLYPEIESNGTYQAETADFYKPGSAGQQNRNNFISSFYLASNNIATGGTDINKPALDKAMDQRLFTEYMNRSKEGFGEDLTKYDSNHTDNKLIDNWFENIIKTEGIKQKDRDYQIYFDLTQRWKQMLNLINNK